MRQAIKSRVKYAVRRTGVEIGSYRWTVAHRRRLLLRELDVLVDVGANVGQYVDEVRRSGWPGEVVSCEPLGEAYAALAARASADPAWETAQVAVGSRPGELELNVSEDSVFSSALTTLDRGKSVYGGMDVARTEVVPMTTLDLLLESRLDEGRAVGVKVDVQGFERDVLEGAERTMRTALFWEMELTPVELYDGQMLMIEALERLRDAGLHLVATENIFGDPATGRSLQFNGLFSRHL